MASRTAASEESSCTEVSSAMNRSAGNASARHPKMSACTVKSATVTGEASTFVTEATARRCIAAAAREASVTTSSAAESSRAYVVERDG
eukprot:3817514-Prymnesium_polylepis.1